MYDHEKTVVGCLLQGVGVYAYEILDKSDFSFGQMGEIYEHLQELNRKGKPIEYQKLSKKVNIGVAELAQISVGALTSTFEGCVDVMKKESAQRKFDTVMTATREGEIDDVIDSVIEELQGINLYRTNKSRDMSKIAIDYIEMLGERANNIGKEAKSGLPKLDRTLGGFHRKEFTIIGARPSVGKSAFGLQIACAMARTKKVLFVSLEMADTQIMERMVARFSGIQHWRLKTGQLKDEDWSEVWRAVDKVAEFNLHIDTTIRTVGQLRSKILSMRPDVVLVDYLGLMQDNSKRYRDKREEMSSITHKIKGMALDYDIPIIGLAQLGRDSQDRKPMLNSLRDSGSLEEDADNVIFLHQLTDKDDEFEYMVSQTENFIPILIMVEKQRNGEKLWIKAKLSGNSFTFMEVD